MSFVITCGDEGIQINEGTRLGILGSGIKVDGADLVIDYLKQLFGDELVLAGSEQNDWIKEQFDLNTYEQADATYQQQAQVLADKTGIPYAGFLEFVDPRQLKNGIKGHLVRPKSVHIGNSISITIGGGEQTFHLGHFVISGEWVHLSDKNFVKSFLQQQIDHYQRLSGPEKVTISIEENGVLDSDIVEKNKEMLKKAGFSI